MTKTRMNNQARSLIAQAGRPGIFAFAGIAVVWLFLARSNSAVIAVEPQDGPLDLSGLSLKSVYENDLNQPQHIVFEEDLISADAKGVFHRKARPDDKADWTADWIAEGTGGCIVKDGKLLVAPTPFGPDGKPTPGTRSHMVVWNRAKLPASFLLQFDVDPCGSTDGLLMVFFCATADKSTGIKGEDLFDLKLPARRAVYDQYLRGALANYSDAYWSRNKIPAGESESNRLRKNPGAELVAQGKSLTTGPTDVTYHLRILKVGGHIQIEINGQIANDWTDPHPLGGGCFGLRSMQGITKVAYSHFKAWEVTDAAPTNPKPQK
jgi:hypothetical protein